MNINCLPQTISKLVLAAVFTLFGLGLVIIGLTVLPIIGLLLSLPVFALAFYFFHAHLNRECEIAPQA